MDQVNLKKLAKELNLAVSTVSRALRDSHEKLLMPYEKKMVLPSQLVERASTAL